jgi:hypothetical protein
VPALSSITFLAFPINSSASCSRTGTGMPNDGGSQRKIIPCVSGSCSLTIICK